MKLGTSLLMVIPPLSIIEAMRSSLPVLGTDVGGVHELIENNINGFLYKKMMQMTC